MPEALRQGIEIWFDMGHLITVWTVVVLMFIHRGRVASRNRAVAVRVLRSFCWAWGTPGMSGSVCSPS
jgi:cytochrome c oxidase assembly factor CtaG